MCGINGIFGFDREVNDGKHIIDEMNRRISYRGPDDRGNWHNENGSLHFGHLRLSILDLSPEGHQPMFSPNGTAIVFNGEIFNFRELKEKYFKDVKLHSTSDTEILLLLYERFGEECLSYLNGMFAFCIWDPSKEKLFLARDRSGKKPLYYSSVGGKFTFSSEIKALLACPWMTKELDEEALYHFLTFNMLPPPQTMFKGIMKMEPGYKLVVSKNGDWKYSRYWEVEYSNEFDDRTESEVADSVFNALQKSVRYRMVSDVPVGAFLSGGVDSSAVVAMMSQLTSHPVKTYAVGFKGQEAYNELHYARQVAERYKTDHHETIITADDIGAFLPEIISIFDEPMADATSIPIYFLSKNARKNDSIVVLTGDGSDELFAGYRNWRKYIRLFPRYESFRKMPDFIRKGALELSRLMTGDSNATEMLTRSVKNQDFFWGGAKSFKESVKSKFLSESYKNRIALSDSYTVIEKYKVQYEALKKNSNRNFSHTDWMCYLGYKFIIPNYYLYRMDHLGMANSIEIRTPFLDHEFVNTALSVPAKWKLVNDEPKYILKKSLERILPHDILYRNKMGFCVPLREWAGELMIDYIDKNLSGFCADHPQFNKPELASLVDKLRSGDESSVNRLWTVYFLIAWFKKWLD